MRTLTTPTHSHITTPACTPTVTHLGSHWPWNVLAKPAVMGLAPIRSLPQAQTPLPLFYPPVSMCVLHMAPILGVLHHLGAPGLPLSIKAELKGPLMHNFTLPYVLLVPLFINLLYPHLLYSVFCLVFLGHSSCGTVYLHLRNSMWSF